MTKKIKKINKFKSPIIFFPSVLVGPATPPPTPSSVKKKKKKFCNFVRPPSPEAYRPLPACGFLLQFYDDLDI